jgi:uncharacterized radical SAM superfamily protein
MPTPTAQTIWNMSNTQLQALLDSQALKPKTGTTHFYAPSFSPYKTPTYTPPATACPTISVTGNTCALNCKHCGRRVLKTMQPALTPTELWLLGSKLRRGGAEGVLVSGGCLPDGSVPLKVFASVLGRFKRELGLTVFVHTGLVGAETAQALGEAGVDAALIDVLGSQQTIKQTLNLKATPQDYADALKALSDAKLRVVPHVIVGLNNGKLDGELHALEIAKQIQPAAVVIIAFMPLCGTEMAQTKPPTAIDVARVAAAARVRFPDVPLALGCMRPKGKLRAEIDVLSLKAGVDAIAFPSEAAVQYAESRGHHTVFSPLCCAQIHLDLKQ